MKCAIYTRVSTSEGLEQKFTSLDNQRESAESYIQSQKSEGWIILPDRYDDGGFTGADTDRPALQKLIEDIKAHRINCIVVYKVDRLSRSHSVKHGKLRYCHYVCLNAQKRGYQECPTRLVNAGLMESKVMECLRKLTDDQKLALDTWENSTIEQKRLTLKNIVKEIRYNGGTGILEIVLNSTQKSHKFNVSKAELKYHAVTPKDRLIRSEPQLRQNLLLAHQIQELIDKNKAKDLKEVSGWLNLSQQRMNQIRSFLFLSPRIQEAIVLQNDPCLFEIPEYKLRTITDELD